MKKFADLKATDGHVQAIIYVVNPFQLAEHRRATEETTRQLEIVFSAGFYEKLLENPDIAREVSEAAANEQSDYYLWNDESPLELVVTEDTVGLLLANAKGTFQAIIECQLTIFQ